MVSRGSNETQDYQKAAAAFRNKCQRVAKEKLIFLDKCESRSHGLAPKGKKALVSTKKQERYQARLDIWGAISYNKALAIDIQNSEDRAKKGQNMEKKMCNLSFETRSHHRWQR